MRRGRRERGWTAIETSLCGGLIAVLLLGVGSVLATTSGVAERSHADMSASQTNRRALERIANLLRGGAALSMSGFDGSGVATRLTYQTVTGLNSGSPVMSTQATLQWQPTTGTVTGVGNPGEVVLIQDGLTRRVAARVPSGGFSVTLAGSALTVHLETFAPVADGEVSRATGETVVFLRN